MCATVAVSFTASASSCAETVTVCAWVQSDAVKVSAPLTVTSLLPLTHGVTVTVPVGCEASTTV